MAQKTFSILFFLDVNVYEFLTISSLFEFETSNFSEKYFNKSMKVKIVDSS